MSSLNGFLVQVPECLEETCDNYVVMQHGQQYSLKLSNHHKDSGSCKPCDADAYIDGKFVGSWRIPFGQNILLERSVNDSGKFTAYRKDSAEAKQAGIDSNSSELGLIKVVFRPGTKKIQVARVVISYPYVPLPYIDPNPWPWHIYWNTTSDSNTYSCNTTSTASYNSGNEPQGTLTRSCENLVGGGTGLSGESSQRFSEVEELSYDEPCTTIFLRLAFRDEEPRPLEKVERRVYSTTIPRPLR
jgi:hypothetical protein